MPKLCLHKLISIECLLSISPYFLFVFLCKYKDCLRVRGITLNSAHDINYDQLYRLIVTSSEEESSMVSALSYIHDLATFEGLERMRAAVIESGIMLDFSNVTPADIAIQLWLVEPELLQRVHQEHLEVKFQSFTYFNHSANDKTKVITYSSKHIAALEAEFDNWFRLNLYGTGNRIYVTESESVIYFVVHHSLPLKQEGSITRGKGGMIQYHPATYDIIKYDRTLNELGVQAKTHRLAHFYKAMIGKHIFGSSEYFSAAQKFTLAPLKSNLKESLVCADIDGLLLVRLTELHIILDDGEIDIRKSRHCLSHSLKRNLQASYIKLFEAVFSVHFTGEEKPRLVRIQVPDIASYASEEDELIKLWLNKRGFIQQNGNA